MAQTLAQLVARIAIDLNVVGLAQTPSDEVSSDISGRIATIVAELNGRQIVNIDTSQIDDGLFEALVEYVIAKAGPGYGRAALDPVSLSLIEDRMAEVSRAQAPRRTLQTDGVLRQGVHRVSLNYWNC